MTARSETRHTSSPKSSVAILIAAALLGTGASAPLAAQGSSYEELQTFSAVLNHIRLNYVDSVTYAELVQAAISGVLRSLDPHSAFFSRREWERRSALERGELAVTGLEIERVDDAITVLAVADGSPGAKAGLFPGDRIATVDDTSLAGLDVQNIEVRLAGPRGKKIRLRLERGPRLEPDTLSVTLTLDFVKARSVALIRMADPVTGYIRLGRFGISAAAEVHDALKEVRDHGASRVILDLRGNPGGLVGATVELASEFFPKKTVVFRTRGRARGADTTYVTPRKGDFITLPLVVLIDEHSASAAEALAASLQDHDRALLLGRRSFGKALMQVDFAVLPRGDDLHLTVGYVVSPSGRVIQRRYRGLAVEQYYGFGGKSGAQEDTLMVFHTDAGRSVRGGGGISPDVTLPAPVPMPVWWSTAADSGFIEAIADSVALTLAATAAARTAWLTAAAQWQAQLVVPFLARVRNRFQILALADSALQARIARNLAYRAAEVRWGSDARDEFLVRNDPAIRAALSYFPRLHEFLGSQPAR